MKKNMDDRITSARIRIVQKNTHIETVSQSKKISHDWKYRSVKCFESSFILKSMEIQSIHNEDAAQKKSRTK